MDGTTETVSASDLTDEQLAAMLAGAEPDADADATDTTAPEGDAVEQTDAEPPADQAATAEQQADPNWNPDGPGDLKVALKQAREKASQAEAAAEQARQQAAEAQQFRQQFEAQQRQYQQQQQAAQTREQLVERLGYVDGEEAAAIVDQLRAFDRQEFQQQAAYDRLALSADMAREALPDFDVHLNAAVEKFGLNAVNILAMTDPVTGEPRRNPAKWAYDLGKSLSTAATFDERVAAEVAKALPAAVQSVLQKQQPPTTQGHKGIAHVSSETPGRTLQKRPSDMTDAELARELGY